MPLSRHFLDGLTPEQREELLAQLPADLAESLGVDSEIRVARATVTTGVTQRTVRTPEGERTVFTVRDADGTVRDYERPEDLPAHFRMLIDQARRGGLPSGPSARGSPVSIRITHGPGVRVSARVGPLSVIALLLAAVLATLIYIAIRWVP